MPLANAFQANLKIHFPLHFPIQSPFILPVFLCFAYRFAALISCGELQAEGDLQRSGAILEISSPCYALHFQFYRKWLQHTFIFLKDVLVKVGVGWWTIWITKSFLPWSKMCFWVKMTQNIEACKCVCLHLFIKKFTLSLLNNCIFDTFVNYL